MNQFIISDDPDILTGLKLFQEQLNANFFTLNEVTTNPHIIQSSNKFIKTIFLLHKDTFLHRTSDIRKVIRNIPEIMPQFIIRAPLEENVFEEADLDKDLYFGNVPEGSPAFFIAKNIINAFTLLQHQIESFEYQYKVNLSTSHISKLTRIGMSLATEKDFTKLLREILYSAREICVADAGSLYLVEKDEEGKPTHLRFKISALDLNSNEFLLPINKQSIAGYVAYTGKVLNIPDVYNLPPNVEYKFNSEFDKSKNYYSKSMLVVPMKNHEEQVIGVIQLINKKKYFHQKLTIDMMKGSDVNAF